MRIIAVASLLLMSVSLAIIYTLKSSPILLALSAVLIVTGIALTFFGGQRAASLLGLVALIVSVFAAGLAGQAWWGSTGAIVLPFVWLLMIYGMSVWAWNSTIWISSGTVLLIATPNGVRLPKGPQRIFRPMPTFEHHYATMPLYELASHIDVEKINTKSLWDIRKITMEIHYRIVDPVKVISGMPNRVKIMQEVATQMNMRREQAMLNIVFWELLLTERIGEEAEDVIRAVVYEKLQKVVEASTDRAMLAGEVQEQLTSSAVRYGVEIRSVEIGSVDLDVEQIRKSKRDYYIKREREDAQRAAELEAQKIAMTGKAQAEVQAHTVAAMIQAIQDQGLGLSKQEIEQIIFNVLEEQNTKHRRNEMLDKMLEVGSAPKGRTGPNGNK